MGVAASSFEGEHWGFGYLDLSQFIVCVSSFEIETLTVTRRDIDHVGIVVATNQKQIDCCVTSVTAAVTRTKA